ncbi:MAG: hypothetical protein CFK52_08200 [Chloracidobacterium sp. CP2_5A]|nr:MAG: hypothetical protein CFK52_08200 [Chloracidobacterium sp. CP2_5A]
MRRVLLVEDDTAIAQIVARWLSRYQEELEVLTAEHGREALDILARQPADVVVTDLQMPVMDGFELIARLLSESAQLPIIVTTAMAVSDVETRLSQVRAIPVIRKPLSVNTLYNAIRNELNARQQGVIQGLTLASFLQLLEVERKSCVLRVTAAGRVGYLYFSDGELLQAETGHAEGEAAAFDILLWEGVQLQMSAPPATPPSRTLHDRLMGLLMEAFRRRDEAEAKRRPAALKLPNQAAAEPAPDLGRLLETNADDAPDGADSSIGGERLTDADVRTAESVLRLAHRLLRGGVEESKTYAVEPELRQRLNADDLPQETVNLLRLLDGRLPIREILARASDRTAAITFLVNGLKAAGLLLEVESDALPPD